MIGVINVEIQAANPQMPLYPIRAFVNSPSSVRIKNVPTEIGAWRITSVRIVAAYPDSSVKTADCVLAGNLWVATIAGCAVSGKSENGFTVFANGVDENGGNVSNYILGKGSIEILKADGSLDPDAPSYYVHLLEEQPTTPNEGDLWPTENGYVIWQDGEAHALGGGSSVTVDAALSTTSENPVQNKVVTAALNGKASAAQGAKADAALSRAEAVAGFTEWTVTPPSYNGDPIEINSDYTPEHEFVGWYLVCGEISQALLGDESATEISDTLYGTEFSFTATRTRLPTMADIPTDNAQLANGAGYATTAAMNAALALKADASALPYALVDIPVSSTAYAPQALFPIKFEGTQIPFEIEYGDQNLSIAAQGGGYVLSWQSGYNWAVATFDGNGNFVQEGSDVDSGTLRFGADEHVPTSADRIVPPNTAPLIDRASSAVSLTADATLVFPAQTTGKARDFVVRLTLTETNNVVPSVTFPADVAYEAEGGEWPDLTEAGTYIVRLTEVPTASESETARFFLQCSSAVADATPPSAGGAA